MAVEVLPGDYLVGRRVGELVGMYKFRDLGT